MIAFFLKSCIITPMKVVGKMVLKEKEKHKGHKSCEQNKNRGIPIFVEEERWDANRGIPKLRCLSIL